MKPLQSNDVEFTLKCLPEDTGIRGNAIDSGDDAYDKQVEDDIIQDLEEVKTIHNNRIEVMRTMTLKIILI